MSPGALVVIGASAGGVEALRAVVRSLPADLDAAVLVVLHIPRTSPSALPSILSRSSPLPAAHAIDGESLRAGRIYIAPPDHHLLAVDGRLRLSRGPTENGHRPAADPLFRSAAQAAGRRTIAVVLSGSRDDGTAGAAAVRVRGGQVLVQDPAEALHPSMPRSVIEHVGCDRVCPAAELGPIIAALVAALAARPAHPDLAVAAEGAGGPAPGHPDLLGADLSSADLSSADLSSADLPGSDPAAGLAGLGAGASQAGSDIGDLAGHPSGLACPTCHGGLFELPGEPTPRYRCWVGHTWSPRSLLAEQSSAFEGALWMALRSLEEKAALARRLSEAAQRRGAPAGRHEFAEQQARHAGRLIRELIERWGSAVGLPDEAEPTG